MGSCPLSLDVVASLHDGVGNHRIEFGFIPFKHKVFQSTLENNELDTSTAVTIGKYESDYMPSRSSQTL